jgi:hypothetical protein
MSLRASENNLKSEYISALLTSRTKTTDELTRIMKTLQNSTVAAENKYNTAILGRRKRLEEEISVTKAEFAVKIENVIEEMNERIANGDKLALEHFLKQGNKDMDAIVGFREVQRGAWGLSERCVRERESADAGLGASAKK